MFPFHPQLFQIKSHGQQEQLCSDVGPAAGEESPEGKIVFQQGKSALHLNRAAQTQMDAPLGSDALSGFRTLLPKSLLQTQMFRLLWVLGPAALAPARTTAAAFTPVPGRSDKPAVFFFCVFPTQRKLSALGAGKAVFFRIITSNNTCGSAADFLPRGE